MKTRGLYNMVRNRLQRKQLYSSPEYWNAKAEEHDARSASMWPNDNLNLHLHREQARVIEELLPEVNGLKILDVGCGTGRMARYFATRGAEVHGFDFSEKAIERAQATPLPEGFAGTPPTYEVKSVFDLDYRGKFDLGFSWGVLTIACREPADLRKAVANVVQSVRPGGRVLFLEPIHRGMLHRVLKMSLGEFQVELEKSGCNILDVRGLHFWPTRVLLAYAPWPRWVTDPVYRVGQQFLAGPQWGDYKLVFAEKKAVDR